MLFSFPLQSLTKLGFWQLSSHPFAFWPPGCSCLCFSPLFPSLPRGCSCAVKHVCPELGFLLIILCAIPVLSEEERVVQFLHPAVALPVYLMLSYVSQVYNDATENNYFPETKRKSYKHVHLINFLLQPLTLASFLKIMTICYFRWVTKVIVYIHTILGQQTGQTNLSFRA